MVWQTSLSLTHTCLTLGSRSAVSATSFVVISAAKYKWSMLPPPPPRTSSERCVYESSWISLFERAIARYRTNCFSSIQLSWTDPLLQLGLELPKAWGSWSRARRNNEACRMQLQHARSAQRVPTAKPGKSRPASLPA